MTASVYGPGNDIVVGFAVSKVKDIAKNGTDAIADTLYQNQDSHESRVARWYGYQ